MGSKRKREDTNGQPFEAIPGTAVKFRAAKGGAPIPSLDYEGNPLAMPDLASLPPCRIEKVEGPVRLVEATPEELAFARRYCPKGPPGGEAA